MTNLYQVLNVDPRASSEVIQAAFKVLAQKYHPDHVTGSVELFQEIDMARKTLLDPDKRKFYDLKLGQGLVGKKVVGSYEIVKFLEVGPRGWS
jgi:DnaJ-class molecular chaperone